MLTDDEQGLLNLKGINVLRVFRRGGRPIVWGARTTATDTNWQYVNIRRLFLFLEESIQEGIRWVGVRAEQPVAVAEAQAHASPTSSRAVARRRAVRRHARGGLLRAHRRGAESRQRARARPPVHRDRRAPVLPGRIHHRAHRHLAGRLAKSAKPRRRSMAMATTADPYRNFNFLVEIDGITQAGFSECSGLRLEHRRHRVPRGRREHHRAQAARA